MIITIALFGALMFMPVVYGAEGTSEVEKPLIIKKGTVVDEQLQYPGYEIIDSNLNYYLVGTYCVTYRNSEGNTYQKKVIVIDEELTCYLDVELSRVSQYGNSRYEITKVVNIDNTRYAVLIEATPVDSWQIYKSHYVALYDRAKEVWCSLYYTNVNGQVNDIAYDGEYIIGTGWRSNAVNGSIDTIFFAFNETGHCVKRLVIPGEGTDIGYAITATDSDYVIVGATDSVETYSASGNDKDGFVMHIDKTTYQVGEVHISPQDIDNYFYDVIITDNCYYLVEAFFDNEFRFVQMDKRGRILVTSTYSDEFLVKVQRLIATSNNKLYFLLSQKVDNQAFAYSVYYLDEEMKYHEVYTETKENCHIQDMMSDEERLVLCIVDESHNYGYYYKILDDNQSVVVNTPKIETDFYIKGLGSISTAVGNNSKGDKLATSKHLFVKIEAPSVVEVDNDLKLPVILVNQQPLILNEHKSSINYNLNVFGCYQCTYYYEGVVDYAFSQLVNVLPVTGVTDGGVYDLGLILKFNGQAILNDEAITNYHQITESGQYELILKGKDESVVTINFKVEPLALTVISEKANYQAEVMAETISHEKGVPEITVLTNNNLVQLDTNTSSWIYLVPALTTIVGIAFIFKTRF